MKDHNRLTVSIRRVLKSDCNNQNHFWYRIEIDGDVFWSKTYEGAVIIVIEVLARDEFVKFRR